VGFLGGCTQKTHRVFFAYVPGCLNPDPCIAGDHSFNTELVVSLVAVFTALVIWYSLALLNDDVFSDVLR